jgi:adenosylcobinamide-phosphate synthase
VTEPRRLGSQELVRRDPLLTGTPDPVEESMYAVLAGFLADLVFGDPARLHPVAGFGWLAERVEGALYAPTRARGIAYTGLLVGVAAVTGEGAARLTARVLPTRRAGLGRSTGLALMIWIALGGRSLTRVAGRLADVLDAGDLAAGRATLPSLCGRDPDGLDIDGLCRAGVESVA